MPQSTDWSAGLRPFTIAQRVNSTPTIRIKGDMEWLFTLGNHSCSCPLSCWFVMVYYTHSLKPRHADQGCCRTIHHVAWWQLNGSPFHMCNTLPLWGTLSVRHVAQSCMECICKRSTLHAFSIWSTVRTPIKHCDYANEVRFTCTWVTLSTWAGQPQPAVQHSKQHKRVCVCAQVCKRPFLTKPCTLSFWCSGCSQ